MLGRFLGIDFGTAKIGLALADSETKIASAYETIENSKNFAEKIREIAEKENIKTIILGKSKLAQKDFDIEEIGEKIKRELGVAVEYQEEMFTTKSAEKNLIEKGIKGIKAFDNQEAARIILQDWLDSQPNF